MRNKIMSFLAAPGAFYAADQSIKDQDFSELKQSCEQQKSEGDLGEALLYAQKAAILYGIPGLMLYFPLNYQLIKQEHNEGELVDQDLVQVLGLILFAKEWLNAHTTTEKEQTDILDSLEQWKIQFLALTSSKDLVLSEATYLMKYYVQESMGM